MRASQYINVMKSWYPGQLMACMQTTQISPGLSSLYSSRISFPVPCKNYVLTSGNWWLHHNISLLTFRSLRTILCLTQLPRRSVSCYLSSFYAFDSWLLNGVEAVIILEPRASWSFALIRLWAPVIRTPNWCRKYDFQKLFMILNISKSPNNHPTNFSHTKAFYFFSVSPWCLPGESISWQQWPDSRQWWNNLKSHLTITRPHTRHTWQDMRRISNFIELMLVFLPAEILWI